MRDEIMELLRESVGFLEDGKTVRAAGMIGEAVGKLDGFEGDDVEAEVNSRTIRGMESEIEELRQRLTEKGARVRELEAMNDAAREEIGDLKMAQAQLAERPYLEPMEWSGWAPDPTRQYVLRYPDGDGFFLVCKQVTGKWVVGGVTHDSWEEVHRHFCRKCSLFMLPRMAGGSDD